MRLCEPWDVLDSNSMQFKLAAYEGRKVQVVLLRSVIKLSNSAKLHWWDRQSLNENTDEETVKAL